MRLLINLLLIPGSVAWTTVAVIDTVHTSPHDLFGIDVRTVASRALDTNRHHARTIALRVT